MTMQQKILMAACTIALATALGPPSRASDAPVLPLIHQDQLAPRTGRYG